MTDAICREMDLATFHNGATSPDPIETIYFGGGTPSILQVDQLKQLLDAIHHKFQVRADAEITLEANPDDIDPGSLQRWKALGINRLSVGIQSFQQEDLMAMNRAHDAVEAKACINLIQSAGFSQYSIDLIYGSPLLSDEQWEEHVQYVISKKVPHVSCYALTVEPNTALAHQIQKRQQLPIDPEQQAKQFELLMNWMEAAGYEHYEISNFALPGCRSQHNSSYWQGKNYYGFGPSAHAYDGQHRRWNIANNALYLQSIKAGQVPSEEETLTPTQRLNEYIMTSLRTIEGLRWEKVRELGGESSVQEIQRLAVKWLESGKIVQTSESLVLTRSGKLWADGIAADLFFNDGFFDRSTWPIESD